MTYQPTPTELRGYGQMQARLVVLLLRYSESEYQKRYGSHTGFEREDEPEELRVYRELAVLFALRDELFEHILPRITRRLSFESARHLSVEEPPTRGRIDWERTLDASWAELPGQPPLALHTRQNRRSFATPGNLLAVATLLEYRADMQRLLASDLIAIGADVMRHPLNEVIERCDRQLAFPQFAALRARVERVLEGEERGVAALEAQMETQAMLPSGNSAYADLLQWRRRRSELRLLRPQKTPDAPQTLGADPRRDNYIYQLWIIYELADMLERQGLLDPDSALPSYLRFRWGSGDAICRYEIRHDQQVQGQVAGWKASPEARHVPGVRPDFYVRRLDPLEEQVAYNGVVYWREPGVVWDAKYYRETDSHAVPSEPIKRMIADLALLGETRGTLLFAFLRVGAQAPDDTPANTNADPVEAFKPQYVQHVRPDSGHDQTLMPDQQVSVAALHPDALIDDVHQMLAGLLWDAHALLSTPRVPACHGIFLDALSVREQTVLRDRWGSSIASSADELLICPKPHIGPWRVDIVSRSLHCCSDPRLCQIIGRPGAHAPMRSPRDINDMLRELERVLGESGQVELDDEAVSAIAERVQQLTRRFADVVGVDFDFYFNRLRDLGMARTLDIVGPVERESLALSEFLKDQLDRIKANDFSAPAIHISSVMEVELKRRIFQCPGLAGLIANPKKQTLGTLPFLRLQRNESTDGNWQRIVAYVAAHWNEQLDPDVPEQTVRFDDLVTKAINRVAQLRNIAAHTNPLSRGEYTELQGLIFQGGRLGYSALNALLIGWKE